MMKNLIFISSILLLISCGPNKGDIYEDPLSQERIEIQDVDKCVEVYRTQKYHNARNDTALSYSKERKIARGNIKNLTPLYSDSSATCIGYHEKSTHPVYRVEQTDFIIKEEEDFLRDYEKVN